MPEQVIKIKLDSNIMREPQRLQAHYGSLAAGIALDIMLWGAWNGSRHVVMHVPQFCEMFGYNRAHIMRPLSKAKLKRLEKVVQAQHLDSFNNSLGWTLMMMLKANLVFYGNLDDRLPEDISAKMKQCRYQKLSVLSHIDPETGIKKKKTGTIATFEFDEQLMKNINGGYFQLVDPADYLSLKTPKGQADHQARRMYLRMTWKRQIWDWGHIKKGVHPSHEEYDDLKLVAGLGYSRESKNANLLRDLLKRVCQLPSIKMKYSVELGGPANTYQVRLKRDGEPLRKPRKKKDKQAAE